MDFDCAIEKMSRIHCKVSFDPFKDFVYIAIVAHGIVCPCSKSKTLIASLNPTSKPK
jgi:hypothetical protein